MGAGASSINHEAAESELINSIKEIKEKFKDHLQHEDGSSLLVKKDSVRGLAIKQLSRHLSRNESFYFDGAHSKDDKHSVKDHVEHLSYGEQISSSSALSLVDPITIPSSYREKKKPGLQVNITLSDSASLLGENIDIGDKYTEKGENEGPSGRDSAIHSIDNELLVVTPKNGTVMFVDQKGHSVSGIGTKFMAEDFIELAALGTGSSGCVMEALHLPTMSLVALKMLPVYNKEKRMAVARELQILYRNLAEMNLVSDAYRSDMLNQRSKDENRAKDALEGGDDEDENELHEEKGGEEEDMTMGRPKRCENLLSFLGAYTDSKSGMINLVIEYMDGGSLEDLVQVGGCQDELILADIARQTLMGLSYLHSYKSVHRDIKPANILCSSNGVIKIADFGISIVLDNTAGFAQSFVGTVCYMSPERITGESYSFSSDIWSFGLTILAVAKGRFPIEESALKGGYWGMIKAICDESPPEPGPNFSPVFASFISRCLQKKPSDRATIDELLRHDFLHQADGQYTTNCTSVEATAIITSTSNHTDTTSTSLALGELASPASPYNLNRDTMEHKADRMTPRSSNSKLGSRRPSLDGMGNVERMSFEKSPLSTELTQAVVRRRSREITPTTLSLVSQLNGFGLIEGIRLEHLDRILNKLAARHQREGVLMNLGTPNTTPRNRFNTTESSSSRWRLLADQLHLPVNVVELMARTKRIELKEALKRRSNDDSQGQ